MIVDQFYVGEHKPWSAFPRGTFRMSGAEMCTRRAGYQFLRYAEDERPDKMEGMEDFSSVVLEEGNIHEIEVVKRIQSTGLKIWNFGSGQTWTVYRNGKQFWRGHPDLFVEIDEVTYGIEIKSTRDMMFQKYADAAVEVLAGRYILNDQTVLHDTTFPYMGQIQLYLHSEKAQEMGIEQWILVVKNRDTGAVLECLIDKDPEYLENIVNKWKPFWNLMAVQRLPDRNYPASSRQCQLCPFQLRCWGPLAELPNKTAEIEDPELVQAADDWRKGKKALKAGEAIVNAVKGRFQQEAINLKANRLKVNGLEVTISNRERTGVSRDSVDLLLEKLVKEGKITPEEMASCYSTSEYPQTDIRDQR